MEHPYTMYANRWTRQAAMVVTYRMSHICPTHGFQILHALNPSSGSKLTFTLMVSFCQWLRITVPLTQQEWDQPSKTSQPAAVALRATSLT
jgi:hypothetical protein